MWWPKFYASGRLWRNQCSAQRRCRPRTVPPKTAHPKAAGTSAGKHPPPDLQHDEERRTGQSCQGRKPSGPRPRGLGRRGCDAEDGLDRVIDEKAHGQINRTLGWYSVNRPMRSFDWQIWASPRPPPVLAHSVAAFQQHPLYGAACAALGGSVREYVWSDGRTCLGTALILIRRWPGLGNVAKLARGPDWAAD